MRKEKTSLWVAAFSLDNFYPDQMSENSVLPWKQISVKCLLLDGGPSRCNFCRIIAAFSQRLSAPLLAPSTPFLNLTTKTIFVKHIERPTTSHCRGPSHYYLSPGFFLKFTLFFILTVPHNLAGSQPPDQGLNPGSQQREHQVPTTGLSGRSLTWLIRQTISLLLTLPSSASLE